MRVLCYSGGVLATGPGARSVRLFECSKAFYVFLTGESPEKWISTGTLSRWTKEVAEISIKQNKPDEKNSLFFSYGIMADESTRDEKKVFILCFIHWNWIKNNQQ